MEAVLFYFFSALAIVSTLFVTFAPRPTRALLAVIVMMAALAGLYITMGAHFIAIAQIIVYAGAVLVLFLFVIMLQGIGSRDVPLWDRFNPLLTLLMGAAAVSFLCIISSVFSKSDLPPFRGVNGTVQAIGMALFTDFLLPFELTSLLLLLSVFAAVALARKDDA